MKKLKLFLPALLLSLFANSQVGQIQQIKIVSFTVKNQLPASIDSWGTTPGALIMVAQKIPNARMVEPRLVVQIRSGGAVICGNNAATAKQVDPFDVRSFNTAELTGMLTNCHELKEGTYTLCVQFFNIDKIPISQEMCRDFRVEATNIEYAPPTLITPDNAKKFTAQELQGVVMFRWTPLVPKPKEPVTYRIKVWQLMEGQNGTMAMRTNQPIIIKDVDNLTQATANGLYTGPCKPPYLCDFIWNVQALNRSGKPMGNNNGMSEPYTFGLAEEKTKGPDNIFPEDNKKFNSTEAGKEIVFRWTPLVPKPSAPVTYRIKVWQLMQGQNGTAAMRSNQPIVSKDVDNITQVAVSGIYTGPCKPPYLCDFIWNVQVVTRDGTPGASSEPTLFSVTEEKSKGPDNIFPEDKKEFKPEEVKQSITFRWTTLVPKPKEPVTYRIKVWQLMEGQNGTAAMRSNQPIVSKDVTDITQAAVSGLYTGPCKPPYLCDFIWNVQVVTRDGTPGATSEPTTFNISRENAKCPTNLFPEDKKKFTSEEAKKEMLFRWTALVPKPQEPVTYRIKVWQLMQGQNGTQAMRTNQPIIEKEVKDQTQAAVTGIYTGPCKPPYLCDFVWMVEAVSKDGRTSCAGEPTTFSVTEGNVKCPANLFPEDKKKFNSEEAKKEMLFRWTPIVPKPQEPVTYRIKVWQLMQGQNGTQAMRTNQPIIQKEVKDQTQAAVTGIYTGPCKPPYLCDFIWMVEAVSKDGRTGCAGEPTIFSVTEENVKCPANLFPEDKKKFNSEEAKKEMLFRWTPIVPKPQEPVTYRIKVWQLMQGQNSTEAMRTNQPIVVKDVDNVTQAAVSGIYTGPCKPPYLCDYVWNVEARSAAGQTGCFSEASAFSMASSGANAEFKIDSATCLPKENGLFKYHIWGHYKNMASSSNNILLNDALNFPGYPANPNPGPGTNLRNNIRMKSGTYNGALTMNDILEASSGTISNITPLPASIFTPASLLPNSTHNFQFDYSTATNSPVQFTYYGLVDDALKFNANRNSRNEIDSLKYPKCPCSACDEVTINVSLQGNITNNGNGGLNFTATVSSSPKKVKRIRAELVYFDMKPEDENCLVCNKNDTYFGNFNNATTANNNFTGTIPYPHSAQFDALGDINISGGVPLSFTISIPPMVSCCNAEVNFCIRYVLTYEDCTVCNKLVCYNYKITGCQKK